MAVLAAKITQMIKKEVFKIKSPNGYGGIRKLSGNRRRPFQVRITKGWEIVDGKEKQIFSTLGYFKSRQEAMIALAEYNKEPFDIDTKKIKFADIYGILWENNFSKMGKSSQASYRAAFKKCEPLHNMPVISIKKAQMQDIMEKTSNMSKASQNAIKVLLRAIFKYCLENDIVKKDYSAFVEYTAVDKESTRSPFTVSEVKNLWANLSYVASPESDGFLSQEWLDTILIMIYTGIRINELLDIKVEHVHLDKRFINLHGTKTKAARRIVPIHKDILPFFEKRIALQSSEWVFPGNDNARLSYSTYKYTFFNKMIKDFKFNHKPHDCRHTFATFAAKSQMDWLLVKRIMGHTSKDLTESVYTHSFIEDIVKEIDKFKIF